MKSSIHGTSTRPTSAQYVVVSSPDPIVSSRLGFEFARRVRRSFHDLAHPPDVADPAGGHRHDEGHDDDGSRATSASRRLATLLTTSSPLVVAVPIGALDVCNRSDLPVVHQPSTTPDDAVRTGVPDVIVLWLVTGDRLAADPDVRVPLHRVEVTEDDDTDLAAMIAALESSPTADDATASDRGPG